MIETNNILSNPTGAEYQFLVGEGKLSASSHLSPTIPTSSRPYAPARDLHIPVLS